MRNIPLSVVFSWPTPNYVNPVTRGLALPILNYVLLILVTFAISLRYYVRLFVKHWFGLDDAFILLAYFGSVGFSICAAVATKKYGWDRHIYDIRPTLLPSALKVAFTAKLCFIISSTFARVSIVSFYYRILGHTNHRRFIWCLHMTMALVVIIGVASAGLSIFMCTPIKAYWVLPPIKGSRCVDEGTSNLPISIVNTVCDLIVTVTPIPIVMKLQMPIRQRIGVVILLSLGLVVTIAGVMRNVYIYKSLIGTYDETWYAYPLWISTLVELDLAVLCACAPAIRDLFVNSFGPTIRNVGAAVKSSLPTSLRSYLESKGGTSASGVSTLQSGSVPLKSGIKGRGNQSFDVPKVSTDIEWTVPPTTKGSPQKPQHQALWQQHQALRDQQESEQLQLQLQPSGNRCRPRQQRPESTEQRLVITKQERIEVTEQSRAAPQIQSGYIDSIAERTHNRGQHKGGYRTSAFAGTFVNLNDSESSLSSDDSIMDPNFSSSSYYHNRFNSPSDHHSHRPAPRGRAPVISSRPTMPPAALTTTTVSTISGPASQAGNRGGAAHGTRPPPAPRPYSYAFAPRRSVSPPPPSVASSMTTLPTPTQSPCRSPTPSIQTASKTTTRQALPANENAQSAPPAANTTPAETIHTGSDAGGTVGDGAASSASSVARANMSSARVYSFVSPRTVYIPTRSSSNASATSRQFINTLPRQYANATPRPISQSRPAARASSTAAAANDNENENDNGGTSNPSASPAPVSACLTNNPYRQPRLAPSQPVLQQSEDEQYLSDTDRASRQFGAMWPLTPSQP